MTVEGAPLRSEGAFGASASLHSQSVVLAEVGGRANNQLTDLPKFYSMLARILFLLLVLVASEAKRRHRRRLRFARELPLRSHGEKEQRLEALILIFRKITSEQKIFFFGRRIHFRGEPARPDTARPDRNAN